MVKTIAAMLSLLLWSIATSGLSSAQTSRDQEAEAFGGFAEVIVESGQEAPYEQEMVLLKIRGYYSHKPARHKLEQPIILNAGWMQLGSDTWTDVMRDGKSVTAYERVMAIFPQRTGPIEIAPFEHRMTFHSVTGRWIDVVLKSEPVVIEAQPKPAGATWWLPLRGLTVTDSWDRPPDQLGHAELAHRVVTIEARGIGPEGLPPQPELRSPGIMAFSDPEERTHELTPEGPVSRVTWRWTVRTITSTPAIIEAVPIPWFDTETREFQEALIAEQLVGLAGSEALTVAPDSLVKRSSGYALPVGLMLGAVLGCAVLSRSLRLRSRDEIDGLLRRLLPDPQVRALRDAARKGDAAAVRFAAQRLRQQDQAEGREWRIDGALRNGLDRLDRSLFAATTAASEAMPSSDLRALVRALLRSRPSRRWFVT